MSVLNLHMAACDGTELVERERVSVVTNMQWWCCRQRDGSLRGVSAGQPPAPSLQGR